MNNYFIKGFIKDNFLGLNGAYEVIEHFEREEKDIASLIHTIIKACKSIEEWTIEVRLDNLKSPFKYGLSEKDIRNLSFNKQIELLQYYCNAYLLLLHISKSTLNKLDPYYKEHLELPLLRKGGDEIAEYIIRCNRRGMDKFNRELLQ